MTEILTKYGDHLYGSIHSNSRILTLSSKGDYDAAIEQYVKTIGNLEPSYVIRKFLDAQRIKNLTTYLQVNNSIFLFLFLLRNYTSMVVQMLTIQRCCLTATLN